MQSQNAKYRPVDKLGGIFVEIFHLINNEDTGEEEQGAMRRLYHIYRCQDNDKATLQKQLWLAIEDEDVESIRLVVALGADPNMRDAAGDTPLCYAIHQARVASVQALLQCGADVSLRGKMGEAPMEIIVRYLKWNGGSDASINQMMCWLLDAGADINACDRQGCSLLWRAFQWCSLDIIQALMQKGANMLSRNQDGNIAFSGMLEPGSITWSPSPFYARTLLRFLKENEVNLDEKNEQGQTLLMLAIRANHELMVRELLLQGASIRESDAQGLYPADYAGEHSRETQLLYDSMLTASELRARLFESPISSPLFSAIYKKDKRAVLQQLAAGADPNECNGMGCVPLMASVFMGAVDCMLLLLSRGANLDAYDKYMFSVSDYAQNNMALVHETDLQDGYAIVNELLQQIVKVKRGRPRKKQWSLPRKYWRAP